MKKAPLALLVSTTMVLGACASKDKGPPPIPPEIQAEAYAQFLDTWDRDGDNRATCSDVDMIRADLFRTKDVNRNGKLDELEFRSAVFEDKSYQLLSLDDLDTDEDGALNVTEFAGASHFRFHHHDKNSDCEIDKPEASEALRELFEKRRISRERDDRTRRKKLPKIENSN